MEVNLMENKCLEAVLAEMKPLLDGQKFVADGEIYKSDTKAVQICFDEATKMFILKVADITEGESGEFAVLSSWLFEDDQTVKDAAAVGIDFADTLRKHLGLKKNTRDASVNIALPTVEKGDAVTITTLTQKLLAFFPEYKDDYKESIAKYGKFLYQDFFITKFVPSIKALLADKSANKKQIKKLFDMLSELYVEGDGATVDQIVAIIAAVIYSNKEYIEIFKMHTDGNEHLQKSVEELLLILKSNKKLRIAIIK